MRTIGRCSIFKNCLQHPPPKRQSQQNKSTIEEDNLTVDYDCGTHTAGLLTVKLLLNSAIKGFCLNTPMEELEFLSMKLEHFQGDVISHYHLNEKVDRKKTMCMCV